MSLSADALVQNVRRGNCSPAYVEARRVFVEKKFTRDTHRGRAWSGSKAKMFRRQLRAGGH